MIFLWPDWMFQRVWRAYPKVPIYRYVTKRDEWRNLSKWVRMSNGRARLTRWVKPKAKLISHVLRNGRFWMDTRL